MVILKNPSGFKYNFSSFCFNDRKRLLSTGVSMKLFVKVFTPLYKNKGRKKEILKYRNIAKKNKKRIFLDVSGTGADISFPQQVFQPSMMFSELFMV